ncbi:hypothetical protein G6F70_004928 [Rhizopus microsporus]|nr:hypothetical protein G6F71_001410 [Rhizopus microsporus]KAG1199448.1 hypothetical protein G6F70_004928 [Rhizopus microsporus]KAG1211234.1 hypothetical protein G6F69_004758 [Rhizopus microsporus]KAG1233060.1 hypothetical protein G6F67_004536 [Rhizopus microsporus]KAG1265129.1 hypothetical protein G6F68_003840 [Rhizopus microsporus]
MIILGIVSCNNLKFTFLQKLATAIKQTGSLGELFTSAEARVNTQKNKGKTTVQYWKNFAEAEFFNIAQRIRKETESREKATEEAEDGTTYEQEE